MDTRPTPLRNQLATLGLLLALFGASYAYFHLGKQTRSGPSESGIEGTPIVAGSGDNVFLEVRGGVQYRRGDHGSWTEATVGDTLRSGDWIKTSRNGAATIRLDDGSTYSLSSAVMLRLVPSGEPTTTAKVAEIEGLDLVQPGITSFGESDRSERPIESPRLTSPPRDQKIDFGTQKELSLAWERVPGAPRYALNVSRKRSFASNVIEDDDRRKPSARIGIRGVGRFYWRVAAYDGSGVLGTWSEIRSFRVTR